MKKILSLVLISLFSVQAMAMQFDRSTVLPELARAAQTAQTALTDYRAANRAAEKAAARVAAGFNDIPKKDRDAAKAKALCQWEASLNTMAARLETFHGTMLGIQSAMETGVNGGLDAMRGKIDGLVNQFSTELVSQQRSATAMAKLYEVSPYSIGESEAQKLNSAMDAVEQRKALLDKLQERRERIATINETIQQKIEGIKAVVDAVEVRLAEVKTEALVVDVFKKEHQVSLLTDEVFGAGTGVDPAKILDNGSSKSLDTILDQKSNTGMSQRELLRSRLGGGH